MEKQAPNPASLDSVTPATRLLEKRRLMYESQDKYQKKQKDYQQQEIHFRALEKDLREKDSEVAEQLVNFAAYLDVNQNAVTKSKANIAKLEAENEEKRAFIQRQKQKMKYYMQQQENIQTESTAVQKYRDVLERVREENSDEYSEIKDILARYTVLQKSKSDLTEK